MLSEAVPTCDEVRTSPLASAAGLDGVLRLPSSFIFLVTSRGSFWLLVGFTCARECAMGPLSRPVCPVGMQEGSTIQSGAGLRSGSGPGRLGRWQRWMVRGALASSALSEGSMVSVYGMFVASFPLSFPFSQHSDVT